MDNLIEVILHLDKYLDIIIKTYDKWFYLMLFAVIFAETGFVITPFLPGDSLLFACGSFAAAGILSASKTVFIIFIADSSLTL
jgi:membrane-associated protein